MASPSEFSPAEMATTMKMVRQHGLPQIEPLLKGLLGDERGLEMAHCFNALFREAEALAEEEVVFELCSDGGFRANGKYIPHDGVGLMLAWLALGAQQTRQTPIRAEWVFPGRRSTASALQALDRAASSADRVSPKLARAIKALGVERGRLVLKNNPQVRLRCQFDDAVAELFRRVTSA